MRCGLVATVLLCFILSMGGAAFGQADFVYFSTDLGTVPYYEAMAVLAFQGLVNRDGPRLYVNTRTLHPWSGPDPKSWRNEWDETWLSIFDSRGYQYETVTSLSALFERPNFRSAVSGLVIYDPDQLASSAWIAMTIAGVEDRLPVTADLLSVVPNLTTWWPDQFDLRPLGDKVAEYQWLVDNYLLASSDEAAYVVGHDSPYGDPGDIFGLDYAVAKGAFVFDLSLNPDRPQEEALADAIVRHLAAPAPILGYYGEVSSGDYAAERGNYVINTVCASNLSFHHQIPRQSADPLVQTTRYTPEELEIDPTKYYLAFVFTDGDRLAHPTRLYRAGAWFDPARGHVPMNWGLNANFFRELPAMVEYYYSTATENDYFYAGQDTRVSRLPNRGDYAALFAQSMADFDLNIASMLDDNLDPTIWDPFLAASGIQAVVHTRANELMFLGDHVPFLPNRFDWPWFHGGGATSAEIAADIMATMSAGPPPAFATITDLLLDSPSAAKEVMDYLTPHGCVFVRLDEMGALARQIDHFYDIGTKYWAHDEVEACFEAGIVQGYSETHYQPTLPVTRDQMAVYISRALAGGDANVPEFTDTPTFPDVPEGSWALDYVEYAVDQNVVGGYGDGTYHPEYEVDRGQMAVYVARSLVAPSGEAALADYVPADPRNFPDVASDFWAYTHVEYCVENGVVAGYLDGLYHPEIVVTRDQMAVYVARAFGLAG